MSTTLGARYRLDALIGGGGMGQVWRAYDEVLNREVAVKVIRDHLADDQTIRERLRTEAQLAGSLHHPGIVDVYDYGEHQEEDGRTTPFLVMPLVDGVSLSALLKSRVALPVGETMAIVAEMAQALAAAHAAEIVHRDLKPANVMLASSGRVMILDFGIARSTDGAPLTQTGTLLGTVDYLSPEQAAGRQATYASDLYALGVVAYTCLTGAPPFHRETDVATALAHLQAPIPALPDEIVASGIGPLVEGLLAKEPSQRPSATEIAAMAGELATQVPTTLGSAADDDTTQPGVEPLGAADDSEPATGASSGEALTMTGLMVGGSGEATASRAVSDRLPPRRTVVVSSALLALVAVVFALMSVVGSGKVEVPDVRKMPVAEAAAALTKAGLKVKTHDVDAVDHQAGTVASQSVAPSSKVDDGSTVDLGVATGLVAIPKGLVGTTYEDAAKVLEKLGLEPQRKDQASTKAAGTVTAVAPDSRAQQGGVVVLTVAIRASTSGTATTGTTSAKDTKGKGGKGGKGKK